MPSKYQIISQMAAETAREITSGADSYTSFLTTAANNFKYSFQEQLLIYAQKPTATACAEIELWNKLGRWVNKGTKGIALLADDRMSYKMRHVFDVSDTNSRAGIEITLWQMKPRYEEAVRESLQNSFGEVGAVDFPHFMIEIAENAVDDNLSDYLTQLQNVKGDSLLEELDDMSLEMWLKDTLKSSVGYMALTRAGIDPTLYYSNDDFSHIYDFNTVEVISVLGSATSDIAEMVIRDMGETIKNLQREEKRQIRTFEASRDTAYHNDNKNERSNDYGTDLQAGGRLSDSQSHPSGDTDSWQIWNAASDTATTLYRSIIRRYYFWLFCPVPPRLASANRRPHNTK